MHILIVDDDRYQIEILKCALEEEGYAVDVAYDGLEGERLAENGSYDLIILDVKMPGKDGFAVCRSLRQKHIKTPISMLSGNYMEESDEIQA